MAKLLPFSLLSPAVKFLLVSLIRVGLLAALLGGGVALAAGAVWGAIAAALIVFAAFGYYAWKLAQLSDWLRDPTAATLPDASGLWGDVLIKLYRMLRDERLNRQSLAEALSNFSTGSVRPSRRRGDAR